MSQILTNGKAVNECFWVLISDFEAWWTHLNMKCTI